MLASTAVLPLAGSLARAQTPARRPNIVFILADDMGYADISCYGRRDLQTPNIDRIAAQGTRFTQAYANSPVCTASRVAIITGRYQVRLPVGLEEPISGVTKKGIGLPPEHPTLPSLLKKVGYGTTLIGKWHLICPSSGRSRAGTIISTAIAAVPWITTCTRVEPARPTSGMTTGRSRRPATPRICSAITPSR
jgi:hypothetical protein